MLTAPPDFVDYAIRHGERVIGYDKGEFYILNSGSQIGDEVLP